MSLSASRAVLRQSAKFTSRVSRRCQSTAAKASEAASKAGETGSDFKSKAAEGLSKVTSSAGPALSGAAKSVTNALGKIGGRTGRLIHFVERQIPSTIYYARVGLELSKLVIQGQKMSPPQISTFQAYFQRLIKSFSNPSLLLGQSNVVSTIRNLNCAQLATGAVVVGEVLGFFTVGEMIGRMKIVGYRGDTGAHH